MPWGESVRSENNPPNVCNWFWQTTRRICWLPSATSRDLPSSAGVEMNATSDQTLMDVWNGAANEKKGSSSASTKTLVPSAPVTTKWLPAVQPAGGLAKEVRPARAAYCITRLRSFVPFGKTSTTFHVAVGTTTRFCEVAPIVPKFPTGPEMM